MALELVDLDDKTRGHMLAERERDIGDGTLYMGKDLSEEGRDKYPEFLREAIESGDDGQLESRLSEPGIFNEMGLRLGKPVKVPINAPQRLARASSTAFTSEVFVFAP